MAQLIQVNSGSARRIYPSQQLALKNHHAATAAWLQNSVLFREISKNNLRNKKEESALAVTRLSYMSIRALDLAASEKHYTDVVGLRVTGRRPGQVYLQAHESQITIALSLMPLTAPGWITSVSK